MFNSLFERIESQSKDTQMGLFGLIIMFSWGLMVAVGGWVL